MGKRRENELSRAVPKTSSPEGEEKRSEKSEQSAHREGRERRLAGRERGLTELARNSETELEVLVVVSEMVLLYLRHVGCEGRERRGRKSQLRLFSKDRRVASSLGTE